MSDLGNLAKRGERPYTLTPKHYLPPLRIKPVRLDNTRPFKGMFWEQPWGADFALLRRELEYRHGGRCCAGSQGDRTHGLI